MRVKTCKELLPRPFFLAVHFAEVSHQRQVIMAFIRSFVVNNIATRERNNSRSSGSHVTPRCCSGGKSGDKFDEIPPLQPRKNFNFQPFDGSKPLLPPWRPESLEAEFIYSSRHVESHEKTAPTFRKIVKVEGHGFATMFAEVVQEVDNAKGNMWLRPLLLTNRNKDTSMDLRGASDIVLEKKLVQNVDNETRLRICVNLMATEEDVVDRVLSDERWDEVSSRAVLMFMKKLSEEHGVS